MMPDRVSAWLESLGLGIYREAFEKMRLSERSFSSWIRTTWSCWVSYWDIGNKSFLTSLQSKGRRG